MGMRPCAKKLIPLICGFVCTLGARGPGYAWVGQAGASQTRAEVAAQRSGAAAGGAA
jgi:hypothetical protein